MNWLGGTASLRLVIRVGGSVMASPPDPAMVKKYAELLKDLRKRGHEVVAVVGGGSLAREMIRVASEMGLKEPEQDEVAISVSRLHASLFMMRLGEDGCGTVPVSVDEAAECLGRGRIVVLGGLKPGMTTDAVAALVAERVRADLLVKATDQDGVFTKDPRKFPDVKKVDRVGFDELSRLFEADRHRAGIHQVLDPEAVKILLRSRVRVVVVNGFRVENVLRAVRGEKVGTLIE